MTRLRQSRRRAHSSLVDDLKTAIGADKVRDDRVARTLYSRDASTVDVGRAGSICFPESREDVQLVLAIAADHSVPVVPRGAGTGLAGGAIPLEGAIVMSTARMDRILSVDIPDRVAWVEPGVVNLELTRHLEPHGLHFAPDPSSQQVCTIGGNVGTNAGGPHCLAYGVTSSHVLAIEVVLPGGEVVTLGGVEGASRGLDLRGSFVGSEGTMGVATKIAVALTEDPPEVSTLLLSYRSVRQAAETVSGIIASGIVPAAIEAMDRLSLSAIEDFVQAGFPTEAEAALLVEVDGLREDVENSTELISEVAATNGASGVRIAASARERALLWKGRKSAFGATAQIAPKYYLHDTVVPRSRLADVLEEVYAIAESHDTKVMNVFHAGDGNLHPLLLFDPTDDSAVNRVHRAAAEIVEASLKVGGVLSGEHGIGIEKQPFMSDLFAAKSLEHQHRLRRSFDPRGLSNPGKVIPDVTSSESVDHSEADPAIREFADEVGSSGPVAVEGRRTRWEVGGRLISEAKTVKAPTGIVSFAPDEMVVRIRAGTDVDELTEAIGDRGQRCSLPQRGGTVGGAIAVGEDHLSVRGVGRLRSKVLQMRYVSDQGFVVTAGGPTVKNVSGYDLPRLMVGALGSLGLIAELTLRTDPLPEVSTWWRAEAADPFAIDRLVFRPSAVLHDGADTWIHLEGGAGGVKEQVKRLKGVTKLIEVSGPPPLPAFTWHLKPSDLHDIPALGLERYVASIGVGTVFADEPQPGERQDPVLERLEQRVKAAFDPHGRLNPGRIPSRL